MKKNRNYTLNIMVYDIVVYMEKQNLQNNVEIELNGKIFENDTLMTGFAEYLKILTRGAKKEANIIDAINDARMRVKPGIYAIKSVIDPS